VLAPAAHAGAIVDRAAAALANDPVYVDPDATVHVSAGSIRREIESSAHGPVYVAILPEAALKEAGGDAGGVLQALHDALGRKGVYAVIVGNHFRAGSEESDLGRGEAGRLATEAFNAHRGDGATATLVDFVDRVGKARTSGGDGGGHSFGWWPVLLVAGAGFFVLRAFRRRRTQAADAAQVKEAAREDLVALADDVQALEDDVERDPRAKQAYLAALDQYSKASGAFDRAKTPQELQPVAEALEEGRYEMAVARAQLDGKPAPERRPACFFDPRHGPSVRDVEWAPPGGQPRAVPACAACALRVEEGLEPESRHVAVRGQSVPYWAAGPVYGGYFGGFFPGLLLGELLGGFGGFGWGAPVGLGGGYGDQGGGDSDAGDFGGDFGDFGGGDFGGGDGGGGDF
jgi:hypothetical protein